jgi:4-hydroxythreonine-4-phosphate dehydrogenase
VDTQTPLRLALTPGEPAGIGPDLTVTLAQQSRDYELVAIADPRLLADRAAELGLDLSISRYDPASAPVPGKAGTLLVAEHELHNPAHTGRLDPANAGYLIDTLKYAASGCLNGEFAAMITGPVQKSVINEGGFAFSGHTEFLAELCGIDQPVMLLCAGELRVALVTTHLALKDVPAAITQDRVVRVGSILAADLQRLFRIDQPRIAILGLNPHSGEAGQLGDEELNTIIPAIETLSRQGIRVTGPVPADSAFTAEALGECDAVLAMYHDQGLPVLKHAGFGGAINVTLGLPIIRTSVDHGTALELAGTGRARADSLLLAVSMAQEFAQRQH